MGGDDTLLVARTDGAVTKLRNTLKNEVHDTVGKIIRSKFDVSIDNIT